MNGKHRRSSPSPSAVADENVRRVLSDPELLAHLSDVVTILDDRLCCLYVSRFTARPRAAMLGSSLLDSVFPCDRERFRGACEYALAMGSPSTLVARDMVGNWWESRIVPTGDEHKQLLFITSTDVTARTLAERSQRERERRLRSNLESTGVTTFNWDATADEAVWDAEVAPILGCPPTEPPRTKGEYLAFVHPDDRQRVEEQVDACLRTGVYEEIEHRVIHPDGEIRHLVCRGTTVVDQHGRVLHLRGGIFDITERKRTEEAVRHAQKMEAVGQLTAGIAHNFNNLLSIALPNLELCHDRAPDALRPPLDDVRHAVERAAELIRQLMRFARQEVAMQRECTDLAGLVRRIAKICSASFDRQIAIDVKIAPDLPGVHARAGEIEQVLLNVCINARDALEEARTPAPRITIEVARESESMLRIAVTDNGPGMDESIRRRLFEPFFTTKELHKGTGLGLASAYGIVVDHQGSIRCESSPGAGSTFVICLPICVDSASEPCEPAPREPSAGSERVLLVDDEPLVRRALRNVLECAGFEVLEAGDGAEGLRMVSASDPQIDLVVLDRSMPTMSGDQFLAALGGHRKHLPVLLLTGYAGDPCDQVDAVLIKPPRAHELLDTVRRVLDARLGRGPQGKVEPRRLDGLGSH